MCIEPIWVLAPVEANQRLAADVQADRQAWHCFELDQPQPLPLILLFNGFDLAMKLLQSDQPRIAPRQLFSTPSWIL
jgi:hypothetical protein